MNDIAYLVNCRYEEFDVYIGRPSKWGNPFEIGKDGTRDQVINQYREWILTQPKLLMALPKLLGKRLGCWCAPKRCHGEVLIELMSKPEGFWRG